MKYLYTIPSGPLRPYPRQDNEPVVGLDTAVFAVLLVQQDPEPEYNSGTEYLAPRETITLGEPEGVLLRTWQVLPIPPAPEQARWVEFGAAVQASEAINQLLGTALQQLPALGLGLGVGLGKAADGDARVFLSSWTMARGLGLVSDELLAGVLSMAAGFDLPAEFTEALTVPPPAQNLGQEWTSPSGPLYRVAQTQENLRWVVVEP